MQLKELVTYPVVTIGPESSLVDAAAIMLTGDLGWLPVEENDNVIGVITDRDIAIRGVAGGLDPRKTKVRDVMTRDVFSCSWDGTTEDACTLMEAEQVRRLVVVDDSGALVGIVSLADIALRALGGQSAEVLKKVTEPSARNTARRHRKTA